MSSARVPMLMQAEAAECGLVCLAMIAAAHGRLMDLTTLRHRFAISSKGVTLQGLMDTAGQIGRAHV